MRSRRIPLGGVSDVGVLIGWFCLTVVFFRCVFAGNGLDGGEQVLFLAAARFQCGDLCFYRL